MLLHIVLNLIQSNCGRCAIGWPMCGIVFISLLDETTVDCVVVMAATVLGTAEGERLEAVGGMVTTFESHQSRWEDRVNKQYSFLTLSTW